MKKPRRSMNFWADITVHFTNLSGEAKTHHFSRRDFDLAGVESHCLGEVRRLYALANLSIRKFIIAYGGQSVTLDIPKENP